MAISLQILLDRSIDRMGDGMNLVVKESALEVIKRAYAENIYVQLSAGFRSIAEQNALYVQGRRGIKGESVVTNAKGGQSFHNYGLAVDYFLLSDDGKTALWTVNDKWRRVAAIAKELGFEWGGDWRSFPDPPHIQMAGGLSIAQLQAGKRPTLTSKIVAVKPKTEDTTVQKEWKIVKVTSGQYGLYSAPGSKWKEDSSPFVGWTFVAREKQVVKGQLWYHLFLGDNSYGWISAVLVEDIEYDWAITKEDTTGYLHPDFKQVAGTIDNGSKIAIIDEQDDKYLVVSNNRPQWVKKKIVELK